MLIEIATLLVVASTIPAATGSRLVGVDPNSLSCDPAGQVFLLLPHFTDCNKYYMCAHGREVEFPCSSPELVFDFVNQGCNWAWATECTLRTPPGDSDEDIEGSGDEPDVEDWVATRVAAAEAPLPASSLSADQPQGSSETFGNSILNCQHADSAARRLPYTNDCQRYWLCQDGVPQSALCSDGLAFNADTQQCDYEGNVRCLQASASSASTSSAQYVAPEDELGTEFIVYE